MVTAGSTRLRVGEHPVGHGVMSSSSAPSAVRWTFGLHRERVGGLLHDRFHPIGDVAGRGVSAGFSNTVSEAGLNAKRRTVPQ